MSSLQELQFELQESVYSILKDKGITTEDEYDKEIYDIMIGECLEVVLRNKEHVPSILKEYGVMKAIMNRKEEQHIDYEGDMVWFGQSLLMDVLRQETEFCFCDYEQRYAIGETGEEETNVMTD